MPILPATAKAVPLGHFKDSQSTLAAEIAYEILQFPSVLVILFMFVGVLSPANSLAQSNTVQRINPELLTRSWSARWITVPNTSPFDYGVYHFRKTFDLQSKPASFVVHVTATTAIQLFINGERVAWGPARGDLNHWRFETVDLRAATESREKRHCCCGLEFRAIRAGSTGDRTAQHSCCKATPKASAWLTQHAVEVPAQYGLSTAVLTLTVRCAAIS